ncbi:MAG: hypothetical protein PHE54_03840 [Bacilli bacterium]|nr:hypothetical protein [Bacilli bacterium]
MINSEHKLTIDDLIINYLIEKTKKGFANGFGEKEFLDFLNFFKCNFKVSGNISDYTTYIKDFIDRKNARDWSHESHILFENGTVKPTYKLSVFDESIVNTYFMSPAQQKKIIGLIHDYLSKLKPESMPTSLNGHIGIVESQLFSAKLFSEIWDSYVAQNIHYGMWPSQCRDIFKYLIIDDLASRIEVTSVKSDLINFFGDSQYIVRLMLQNNDNLKMSSYSNVFLAYSNYTHFINGLKDKNQHLLAYLSKIKFEMDFKTSEIQIGTVNTASVPCYYDEDYNYITSKQLLGSDEKVKKIVRALK